MSKLSSRLSKSARFAAAALAMTTLLAPLAEARPGGGFSTGSRGFKTFTPPPTTRTAPGSTQQIQRSAQPAPQAQQAARPGVAPAAAQGSRFGGGFLGGLLGAGLIGGLLGAGFFGGMNGIMGFLGFIVQAALLFFVVTWVIGYFRRRNQPAAAGMNSGFERTSLKDNPRNGGGSGMGYAAPSTAPASPTQPIKIAPADFDSFERLLSVIQLSFSREDVGALRSATTQEMLGYFTEQLEDNARKGVRNDLGEPKLLSGDLAESWCEASGEYATVAMKYTLTDAMVDRTSGRVVSGSQSAAQEVTEVWTFTRRPGGGANAWRLSAIQQVS